MVKNVILLLLSFLLLACNNAIQTTTADQTDTIIPTTIEVQQIPDWDSIVTSDDETNYTAFIQSGAINKKQIHKTKYGKEEITYLGDIKDGNGKSLSHILSIYAEVQAAVVVHGNSRIVFIHSSLRQKKEYYLDMPDELPFELKNNNLYFHTIDSETNKESIYIDTIGTELPSLICSGPSNCH